MYGPVTYNLRSPKGGNIETKTICVSTRTATLGNVGNGFTVL